jgi:hypothetical protein
VRKRLTLLLLVVLLAAWSTLARVKMTVGDYYLNPPANEVYAQYNGREVLNVRPVGRFYRLLLQWEDRDRSTHRAIRFVRGSDYLVVTVWFNP